MLINSATKISIASFLQIIFGCSLTLLLSSCESVRLNNWTLQTCAPTIKWQGAQMTLSVPNVVGTVTTQSYQLTVSEASLRNATQASLEFVSMIDQMCNTLIRLNEEANIAAYSNKRDALLGILNQELNELSASGLTDEDVKKIIDNSDANMNKVLMAYLPAVKN